MKQPYAFDIFINQPFLEGIHSIKYKDIKLIAKRERQLAKQINSGYKDRRGLGVWVRPLARLIPGILVKFINNLKQETMKLFVWDVVSLKMFEVTDDDFDFDTLRFKETNEVVNDMMDFPAYWRHSFPNNTPLFYNVQTNLTVEEMLGRPNSKVRFSRIHILSLIIIEFWFNTWIKQMPKLWFKSHFKRTPLRPELPPQSVGAPVENKKKKRRQSKNEVEEEEGEKLPPPPDIFKNAYIFLDYNTTLSISRAIISHVRNVNIIQVDSYFTDDYIVFDTQRAKWMDGIKDSVKDDRSNLLNYFSKRGARLGNIIHLPLLPDEDETDLVTVFDRKKNYEGFKVIPLADWDRYGYGTNTMTYSYATAPEMIVDRIYNLTNPLQSHDKVKLAPITPDIYHVELLGEEYVEATLYNRHTILLTAKTINPNQPRGLAVIQMKDSQLIGADYNNLGPQYGKVMTVQILASKERQSALSTGAQLISEIMSIASENEFDIVELDSVVTAVEFYRKQDFTITLDFERDWWRQEALPAWDNYVQEQARQRIRISNQTDEFYETIVGDGTAAGKSEPFISLTRMRAEVMSNLKRLPYNTRIIMENRQKMVDLRRIMLHEAEGDLLLLMRRGVPAKGTLPPSSFSKLGYSREMLF